MAKLIAKIEGNFSAHKPDPDPHARIVLMKEHPSWGGGDDGHLPLFDASGIGTRRVLLREHGPGDYRVTAWWDKDRIAFQTIPCSDLIVACYLANCVTMSFRMAP